jgi:hypothetical protein
VPQPCQLPSSLRTNCRWSKKAARQRHKPFATSTNLVKPENWIAISWNPKGFPAGKQIVIKVCTNQFRLFLKSLINSSKAAGRLVGSNYWGLKEIQRVYLWKIGLSLRRLRTLQIDDELLRELSANWIKLSNSL